MSMNTLASALLDLAHELPELPEPFLVGGGFGLYLKQRHLEDQPGLSTLIPGEFWPPARATEDIDLILPTEVIVDLRSMQEIRAALDRLGYKPHVRNFQFVKETERGPVKVDLLTCDVPDEQAAKVQIKPPRVRPVGDVKLHAYRTREALALRQSPFEMTIAGVRSDGIHSEMAVCLPNSFTYMLMKLHAFQDRVHDEPKNLAEHHALDLYRIVAMLTRDEYELVTGLVRDHGRIAATAEARQVVAESFRLDPATGLIRLESGARSAGVTSAGLQIGEFRAALSDLFGFERFGTE